MYSVKGCNCTCYRCVFSSMNFILSRSVSIIASLHNIYQDSVSLYFFFVQWSWYTSSHCSRVSRYGLFHCNNLINWVQNIRSFNEKSVVGIWFPNHCIITHWQSTLIHWRFTQAFMCTASCPYHQPHSSL